MQYAGDPVRWYYPSGIIPLTLETRGQHCRPCRLQIYSIHVWISCVYSECPSLKDPELMFHGAVSNYTNSNLLPQFELDWIARQPNARLNFSYFESDNSMDLSAPLPSNKCSAPTDIQHVSQLREKTRRHPWHSTQSPLFWIDDAALWQREQTSTCQSTRRGWQETSDCTVDAGNSAQIGLAKWGGLRYTCRMKMLRDWRIRRDSILSCRRKDTILHPRMTMKSTAVKYLQETASTAPSKGLKKMRREHLCYIKLLL